jgi:hypothetical protein
MPNMMPNEDELHAALEKMEATDATSITVLRKRTRHTPLRNIISGLWFAILYQAVNQRSNPRSLAIDNLVNCLRAGKEISSHINNTSKMISKLMRLGRASWIAVSKAPGLLAVFDFSTPRSKSKIRELRLEVIDDELCRSASCY